ncbi:MAG: hypothetical protein KAF91_31655 [Nostoc sp. TH1S01]|nr:hypothetical protein [Nostoc sp. TH1S01]
MVDKRIGSVKQQDPTVLQTAIAGTPNANTLKPQAILELKHGFTGGDRRHG